MPSPFPGMNPYLEHADVWQDFHQSYIPLLRQLLAEQVRPKYLVKIEEQIFIHELPADQRWLLGRGDMTVSRSGADSTGTDVVLLEAPAIGRVPLSVDVERHAFLEIRDRGNRQLVTVLELLSHLISVLVRIGSNTSPNASNCLPRPSISSSLTCCAVVRAYQWNIYPHATIA